MIKRTEKNLFNSISESIKQGDVDTLVDVLLLVFDIETNEKNKIALQYIIVNSQKGTTLSTIINKIESKNAAQLGLSGSTYKTIKPLLIGLSKRREYVHYFDEQ